MKTWQNVFVFFVKIFVNKALKPPIYQLPAPSKLFDKNIFIVNIVADLHPQHTHDYCPLRRFFGGQLIPLAHVVPILKRSLLRERVLTSDKI
jgi:hypothetical protein